MPRSNRPGSRNRAAVFALAVLGACGGGKDPSGPGPLGTLDFQVTGLPGATTARITLAGPAGYLKDVTGSGRLSGLAAGTYIASTRYVIAQSQTWTPQVASDTIDLAVGDTVLVQVDYLGGPLPTVNYGIAGYQLIQSVQRTDNSVPMVAQRAAMLRIFGTASGANTSHPTVRLRLFMAGVPVDSFDVVAQGSGVPLTPDTASLSSSWNVLIPAQEVVAGLSFTAEIDPDDAIPEIDKSDNRSPASGTIPVAVQSVAHLDLRFVPVKQNVNGLTGAVANANKDNYASFAGRVMPLGTVAVDVRAAYTTAAPVLQSDDANGAWSTILSEMNMLRGTEGAGRHYVGVVPITYGGGIAGLGYIGLSASVAWDKFPSAPEVIAHEMGHNFGRSHAPCGNPSGVDPQYPYAAAGIGVWGMDLGLTQVRSPSAYKDLMSYCNPDWISDYNYMAILAQRGSGPAVASVRAAAAPGLMVWGRVIQGNVILEPSFEVYAPALLPPRAGTHRVEGFDGAGTRIFGLSFEGDLVPDLPHGEERHFAFVVPLSQRDIGRVASIRLVGQGLTGRRSAIASLRAAGAGTRAVSTQTVGAEAEVRWNSAYPLAVIRDSVSGEILGLGRGGILKVDGVGRTLRVDLSDGVTSVPGAVTAAP